MNLADVIYVLLLFFSIGISYFYRKIEDVKMRKYFGTAAGIFLNLIVSGRYIIHALAIVVINSYIILNVHKRYCHIVSFTFSFSYLIFLHYCDCFETFYIPQHTKLIQMMLTYKMIGLASEVNYSYLFKKEKNGSNERRICYKNYCLNDNILFCDIFHYGFSYIGFLAGPYYTYKTFSDSFDLPFHKYAKWKEATIERIKYVPLFFTITFISNTIWPSPYILTEEFYSQRSLLYRFLYVWPVFLNFRVRLYTGLVLSECACTMANFGAYPAKTDPTVGWGPTKNLSEIEKLKNNEKLLKSESYNFETITNIKPLKAELTLTFKEAVRCWNMSLQFWLFAHIHRRLSVKNKLVKTAITLIVSGLWHGIYFGYFYCYSGGILILIYENIWVKLKIEGNKGLSLKIWTWIFRIWKLQVVSYQGVAFYLRDKKSTLRFYNSIYHVMLFIFFLLTTVGFISLKLKTKKNLTNKSR